MRVVLLSIQLCLAGMLAGTETRVYTVATLGEQPPYCFFLPGATDSTTELLPPGKQSRILTSLAWEILRSSLHSQGLTIRLLVVPWPRVLSLLNDGYVDGVFPAGVNSQRLKIYRYSVNPLIRVHFTAYTRSDFHLRWQGIRSFRKMRLAGIRNFNFGDIFVNNPDIKVHEISSIRQGFEMLQADRIDGFLIYRGMAEHWLKKNRQYGNFKQLPVFGRNPEFLIVNRYGKRAASGKKLLTLFDRGWRQLQRSGQLQRIQSRWR